MKELISAPSYIFLDYALCNFYVAFDFHHTLFHYVNAYTLLLIAYNVCLSGPLSRRFFSFMWETMSPNFFRSCYLQVFSSFEWFTPKYNISKYFCIVIILFLCKGFALCNAPMQGIHSLHMSFTPCVIIIINAYVLNLANFRGFDYPSSW